MVGSPSAQPVKSLEDSPSAKLISLQWQLKTPQKAAALAAVSQQLSCRTTPLKINNASFTRLSDPPCQPLQGRASGVQTSFPCRPFVGFGAGQWRLSYGPPSLCQCRSLVKKRRLRDASEILIIDSNSLGLQWQCQDTHSRDSTAGRY